MAAFLSVALLPIGLVAVVQTQKLAEQAESNAELALSALTEQAAARERMALSRAGGIAQAFAATAPLLARDIDLCSTTMADTVAQVPEISFIGYVPLSGQMTCSSNGAPFDFSENEDFRTNILDPRSVVTVNRAAPISGTSVVIVSEPVYDTADDGAFVGYVSVSIPHANLELDVVETASELMVDLITFNDVGVVLTAVNGMDGVESNLPADRDILEMAGDTRRAWTLDDRTGTPRIYTIATIEPGQVFALGVWDRGLSIAGRSGGDVLTSLFPALMWLAGLLVALVAVHRLVTRHLQVLGRQMALFTAARRLPDEYETSDPPTEIRRIQRAFYRMTDALIRDEASLEDAVRGKSVLVKEIHHRVKNNLQLISSIINMQIRDVDSPEAKAALRQTQDRVLSMATIHRDLYQTNETGLVNVGHLLSEVVGKTMESNPDADDIDLRLDVEDVWLYPDQAVPMSLLASEAVINALKHMPSAKAARRPRYLSIALSRAEDRTCVFHAENATQEAEPSAGPSRGMGRKLIQAFATQLGGKVETTEQDGAFTLNVTFSASEFAPAPGTF